MVVLHDMLSLQYWERKVGIYMVDEMKMIKYIEWDLEISSLFGRQFRVLVCKLCPMGRNFKELFGRLFFFDT